MHNLMEYFEPVRGFWYLYSNVMEQEQYRKIYFNGLDHYKAAASLAEQKMYGFAVSHLILGLEELLKFMVVQHNSADEQLFAEDAKESSKKSVFRHHSHKHNLLAEFQQSISPGFMGLFEEHLKRSVTGDESKAGLEEFYANRFRKIGPFLHTAYGEINIPESEKEAFYKWLSGANEMKNRGFYVDRKKDEFSSPPDITEEEYKLAWKFCSPIIGQANVLMSIDMTEEEEEGFWNEEIEVPEEIRLRILGITSNDPQAGEKTDEFQ